MLNPLSPQTENSPAQSMYSPDFILWSMAQSPLPQAPHGGSRRLVKVRPKLTPSGHLCPACRRHPDGSGSACSPRLRRNLPLISGALGAKSWALQ